MTGWLLHIRVAMNTHTRAPRNSWSVSRQRAFARAKTALLLIANASQQQQVAKTIMRTIIKKSLKNGAFIFVLA